MYINIIKSYRNVIAICDKELIGKRFEEGNKQLDLKESFYKGEEVDEKSLKKIINDMKLEDATFNIVGKKSINLAIQINLIDKNSIGIISGIPYALVLL